MSNASQPPFPMGRCFCDSAIEGVLGPPVPTPTALDYRGGHEWQCPRCCGLFQPIDNHIATQDEARRLAIEWQHWQSERSMSYAETLAWTDYFYVLAERFDLFEEFRENSII